MNLHHESGGGRIYPYSVPVGKYLASWIGQLLLEAVIALQKVNNSPKQLSQRPSNLRQIVFLSPTNICYKADKGQHRELDSGSNLDTGMKLKIVVEVERPKGKSGTFPTGTAHLESRPLRKQNDQFTKCSAS